MKRSLILLVIVLALASWVWWFEVREETRTRSTEEQQQALKTLVGAIKSDILGFTLSKDGQDPVTVKLANDDWVLVSPVAGRTDEATFNKVLYDLEFIEKAQTIEAGEVTDDRLASYGLDNPRGYVDVLTKQGVGHFIIGGENPGGDLIYVRDGETGPVHLVKKKFASHIEVTVFQMRDKNVVALAPTQLGYVKLFGATKAVLSKDDGQWNLADPFEDHADEETVNGLLKQMVALKIISFVNEEPEDASVYGLGPDAEYISVGEAKGAGKSMTVRLGAKAGAEDGGDEFLYARLDGQKPVFTLKYADVASLFKTVPDLQSKNVVRMDPYMVKRVNISHGLNRVELAKPEFDWEVVKPYEAPASADAVKNLFDAFKQARVESFISPEPDSSRLGFDVPSGSFSYVQGDKQSVGVVFGAEAGEGLLYAKRTDTPGAFTVSKSVFDKLATPALEFHTKQMQQIDMGRLAALLLKRGDESYRLEPEMKGGYQVWRMVLPAAAPANQAMMMQATLRLSTTRAASLVARAPQDLGLYGLQEPALRVDFVPQEGADPTKALLIGKKDDSGNCFAMLEGSDVVFTVDKSLVSLLREEVRDPAVFAYSLGDREEASFKSGEESYVARKVDGQWRVASPAGLVVKASVIKDELLHLSLLETQKFVSYRTGKLAEYGLEKPRAVVRIVSPSGVAAISVGALAQTGHYYATSTTVEGVFLLMPGDLVNVLEPGRLFESAAVEDTDADTGAPEASETGSAEEASQPTQQ